MVWYCVQVTGYWGEHCQRFCCLERILLSSPIGNCFTTEGIEVCSLILNGICEEPYNKKAPLLEEGCPNMIECDWEVLIAIMLRTLLLSFAFPPICPKFFLIIIEIIRITAWQRYDIQLQLTKSPIKFRTNFFSTNECRIFDAVSHPFLVILLSKSCGPGYIQMFRGRSFSIELVWSKLYANFTAK